MIFDSIHQVKESVVVVILNTLLYFQLAGFREFGKNVFFCRIPQIPRLRTIKVLKEHKINQSIFF